MPSSPARRLALVAAVAVLAVTGAVVVSASSNSAEPQSVTPSTLLAGIPENRGVLGDPQAPLTLTEFVDPQCPVCAAASREILPAIVTDFVRPGRVKLDAQVLSFLGPDSVTAARWADAARQQDRLWPFLEAFLAGQGAENSGYVTGDFLTDVAEAAGVDADRAAEHARSAAPGAALDEANGEAQRLGVTGTPTFVLTDEEGRERIVAASELERALTP